MKQTRNPGRFVSDGSAAVSALLSCLCCVYVAPAYAQDRVAEGSSSEEIIVTARRREENLQSSPVTVTAFTGAQLAARGIADVQELAKLTPGFTVSSANGSTLGGVATIRAQSQPESGEASLDPSVGFYIDDVYIARQNGIFPGLFDIQTVQTLKGPQGTLFGRNTTGGAVVVTTRQPELGVTNGYSKATIGNYDAKYFQGALNLPIGENIAVRAGGSINRRDGFAVSTVTGHEYENEHNEAYRVQALAQLSETAKLTLAYNGANANQGGVSYYISEVDTRPGFGVANDLSIGQAIAAGGNVAGFTSIADVFAKQTDLRRTASNMADPHDRLKLNSFAATLDIDVGEAKLKIIGAHRNLKSDSSFEDDASPFTLLELEQFDLHSKQDSLEARISGTAFDGKLNWISGAYYLKENARDTIDLNQLNLAFVGYDSKIRNETYSGFIQGDYQITDKLSATAGIRVGRDNREVENFHTVNVVGVGTFCQFAPAINLDAASGGCRALVKAGFTEYAYQLGLNYQANSDLLLYATHKRGFRSGVINERAVEAETLVPFDPEVIYDFELGSKYNWQAGPDLRGRLNAAAYYSIFKNRQVSFVDVTAAGTSTTVLEAAEKAHTLGFEVEGTANYGDWLSLWGSVAYTDPEYDKFIRRATTSRPAIDVSGQPVSQTAKWQYNVGGELSALVGGGETRGFAQVNWAYQSSQFFGFSPRKSVSDPGHGLLDASLGLRNLGREGLDLKVFGKNLLNKTYVIQAINLGFQGEPSQAYFGLAEAALGAPRTYGVELTLRF